MMVNEKKSTVMGLLLNVFMFSAIILAFFITLSYNIIYGMIYGFIVILSIFLIIRFYCVKCSCKSTNCSHLWFGKIASRLFKEKNEPYNILDKTIQYFYIFGIMIMPIPF